MKSNNPPLANRMLGLSPDRVRALTGAPAIAPVKLVATSDIGRWLDVQRAKIIGRVNTFQVEVTPALAGAWLKFNTGNRKPSAAKIRRFSTSMKTHHWELNGETVKFSVTGRLIDGQSRLMAIIEADVPIVLEVRGGLPDLAQQSMDCGELRKNSHTLEMMGEANPGILAPALRLVWLHDQGRLFGVGGNKPRVLENGAVRPLLDKHAGLKASVGWAVSTGNRVKHLMPLSEAAFFHYECGRRDSAVRDPFFEALAEGLGLTKLSPVYHLRERLLASRKGANLVTKAERFALFIKAWNHAVAGEKITQLRFTARGPAAEKFPALGAIKGTA